MGEGITRFSGERGYSTVINLVSRNHKLTVTHPNYEIQSVDFKVVSGETTEVVIFLRAR